MPCCAQFTEDDVWYRGKITSIRKGNLVGVHFIDYGNSEVLPLSRTRPLKPEFMKLGPQAIKCTLNNIHRPANSKWPEEAINRFEELSMATELVLRADSYNKDENTFSVLLLDTADGKNLNISDEIAPLVAQKVGVDIPSLTIKKGDHKDVYVTSVSSIRKFFCQVMKSATALDELMSRIEDHYSPLGDMQEQLTKPVVGAFCAAKYALDDGWYRAKIISVHDNSLGLHYIDYGNTETLPVSRAKVLQPEFAKLPSQVFACTLGGPIEGLSDDQFKDLVFDKEFKVQVLAVSDDVVEVELVSKETGRPVIESLKKKEKVLSVEVPGLHLKTDERKMVYVTVVESVSKFFCQATEMLVSIDELMNNLESHYSSLADHVETLLTPEVGTFCAAKFTEDQLWYRAKITKVNIHSVEVIYIDYGNVETLPYPRLKILQPEFAVLPAQALHCSLAGLSVSPSEQICTRFSELSCGQEFEAHVVSLRPDCVAEVELYSENGALLQDLLSAERKVPSTGKKPCLSSVIVHVRVVFRNTVVGVWHFSYPSGSHSLRQVSLCQMMVFMPLVVVLIGQFCHDVIGYQDFKVATCSNVPCLDKIK